MNNFRHQEYTSNLAQASFELLTPELPPSPDDDTYADRLAAVGDGFSKLGVTTIGLMHGTFVGTDAFGMIRQIGRLAPGLSTKLMESRKQISDRLAGESGNFTIDFAQWFATHLNRDIEQSIEVCTFDWSSENNHTGRADGAIHLVDRLLDLYELDTGRVLLMGHSHAGNVFALATNLLTADGPLREQFFDAVRVLYAQDTDSHSMSVVDRVRSRLADTVPKQWNIDVVTFGTPVRYGWETSCLNSLTHFIHHRPAEGLPVFQAPFPPHLDDVVRCRHGDFVQQVGIAGTDFLPYLLSRTTRLAERRLSRLLQPGLRRRDVLERLKSGQRLHDQGTNLLVDYADDPKSLRATMIGHGIYTRREWLVFHAEEILRRWPSIA